MANSNSKILAVGIQKLYYGDVITDAEFDTTPGAKLYAMLNPAGGTGPLTEVENVHQDTWSYEEAEASITQYKNQLTDNTYYADSVAGDVQESFSIGQYMYKTKADLQGGTVIEDDSNNAIGWKRGSGSDMIYKSTVAKTKDGKWIVFPKALIVARGSLADNAIKVAVVATPVEPDTSGLSMEYWIDDSEVKASVG